MWSSSIRFVIFIFILSTLSKKFTSFPVPGRDVNKQTLRPGKIKLFPARERVVTDIPAGDGKIYNLFYSVHLSVCLLFGDQIRR